MARWYEKAMWSLFALWSVRYERILPFGPRERLLSIQRRRVRSMVKHAYETVPYYREVMDDAGILPEDIESADDVSKLPLLTGDQIAESPQRFLSSRYGPENTLKLHSTGTTGPPKDIHYNSSALFQALAQGQRQRAVLGHFIGRKYGYREVNLGRPGDMSTVIRSFYESHSWVPRAWDLRRRILSIKDSFEENIQKINEFRPDVVSGYGSYIGAIFRHAWVVGLPLALPKVVHYGADQIPEADRRLIEDAFGVPVYSSYQAIEALRIAFQCERREGFHISLDHVAVRVVDERGNALGPGEAGQAVISNLVNRATVLLNYKLGDVIALSGTSCPCGRTLPTIRRIEGRTDDMILRPGGQMLHPLVFLTPLQSVSGVARVQMIQESLQCFRVRVVCDAESDWEQVRRGVESATRSILGGDISVNVDRVHAIPPEKGGKVRKIISRCA